MLILTGGPRGVCEVWFTPDGRGLMASAWNGEVRGWRLDAPGPAAVVAEHRPTCDWGRLLTVDDADRYVYRLPGGVMVTIDPEVYPQAAVVLADGGRFAAAERQATGDDRGHVPAWLGVRSLADGAELARLPFRYAATVRLVAVPHSARVVGTAGGRLVVWDCDAGTAEEVPGPGRTLFRDVAAHPAGRVVAAVRNTPAVWLLDPHAVRVAGEFDPGIGRLAAVGFSPDGLLGAAAGERGRVAVWDVDG